MLKKMCFSICLYTLAVGALNAGTLEPVYRNPVIESQLQSVPANLRQGFRIQGIHAGGEHRLIRKSFEEKFSQTYSTEQFNRQIRFALEHRLTDNDWKELSAWHQSPLGIKIEQLHASGANAVHQSDSPPDESAHDRASKVTQTLISALDQALMATDSALDLAIHSQATIAFAATVADASTNAHNYNDFFDVIASRRTQMQPDIHEKTLARLHHIYSKLTDSELRSFISFAISPAGTRYAAAIQSGIKNTFILGSEKLGIEKQGTLSTSLHTLN